ncbi:MAG: hypothetical protein VXV96_15665 [Bdellovibrionota bacterium]|jgi:hypothetical protein|nr:hypothetical protein [Bdellovibrionota bacterium]
MKTLIALSLISFNTFGALTMTDVAGSYEITHPALPVSNIVTLKANGSISLSENSPFGTFNCEGQATLTDELLTSEVTCDNGATFTQEIDLTGVTIADTFEAPVYSSLYQAQVVMTFTKL